MDFYNKLISEGYYTFELNLPENWYELTKSQSYKELDLEAKKQLMPSGLLFKAMQAKCPQIFSKSLSTFEHILSLRVGPEEEEYDGIWHDDGSRLLAFSLSLNLEYQKIRGGHLSLRNKLLPNEVYNIHPRDFGTITIFCTGQDGWEHKTNLVSQGERLVLAGWLT